jgi:hypothetical protein
MAISSENLGEKLKRIIRYLVKSELGECGLVTSGTIKVFSWRGK